MKLTALLLTVLCLQVSAKTFSQDVTIAGKNMQMRKVFDMIEKQTGYAVFSNRDLLAATKQVTVKAERMPLQDFLRLILKDEPVSFQIVNNTIVLSRKAPEPIVPEKTVVIDTLPNEVTIRAAITDIDGNPIPRASVILKGTNRGTLTSDLGIFTFTGPDGGVLLVKSVGFQAKEIPLHAGVYRFQLEVGVNKLNETVVNGLFSRRAETYTGAAQTYTREQLMKMGNINIIQSLRNIDPAFNVRENLDAGSDPNAMPSITIRGQTSLPNFGGAYIGDPNLPLFILDGFEASLVRIMDLDMNRVSTVTILKDAAAKAIYGSKAANGVVVIETIQPKGGKLTLSYTGSGSISAPDLSSYNLTNSAEKLDVEKSAGLYTAPLTSNGLPDPEKQYVLDAAYNQMLEQVLSGVNTDWLSKPLRTGFSQRHSLSMDGGADALRYRASFQYNTETGVMKGSNRTTTGGAVQFTYRKRNIAINEQLDVQFNNAPNSPYGSFASFARMNPYYKPTDEYGRINKIAGQNVLTGGYVANPLWNGEINTKSYSAYTQISNNLSIEWQVINSLKLTARMGLTNTSNTAESFLPASHTNFITYVSVADLQRAGQYTQSNGSNRIFNGDLKVDYIKTFGLHFLQATAGWSLSSASNRSITVSAEGFPNDFLDDISFARQYTLNTRPSGTENTTRDAGLPLSIGYSYDNRYSADVSYRMNASSAFGKETRWGKKFWSTGLAWNVHREAFARNWKTLNQLKIRGSLGYTGSLALDAYQARSTFQYNADDNYLGNFGAYLMGHNNDNLQWQQRYDKNLGVDMSLLNGKITSRFDYYTSLTQGLIIDMNVPYSTGFPTYKENLGTVMNKGWEVRLGYKIWSSKQGRNYLIFNASASHNKSIVKDLGRELDAAQNKPGAIPNTSPWIRFAPGQSMTALWAVPSYGIDPATGKEIFVMPDGQITYDWNALYQAVVGDSEPTYMGNAGLDFRHGGFTASVSTNWRFGGQIYNQTLVDKVENADLRYNLDRRIYSDRWRKPGDYSLYKDIKNTARTLVTQRFVEDNNTLNIAAVSLGYDFSNLAFVKKSKISNVRFNVNMNDLAQISSVRLERGTQYPFARRISFSLSGTL